MLRRKFVWFFLPAPPVIDVYAICILFLEVPCPLLIFGWGLFFDDYIVGIDFGPPIWLEVPLSPTRDKKGGFGSLSYWRCLDWGVSDSWCSAICCLNSINLVAGINLPLLLLMGLPTIFFYFYDLLVVDYGTFLNFESGVSICCWSFWFLNGCPLYSSWMI